MKFKEFKKTICLGLLFLTGCTTPVTPDFSGMSAKYASILVQYQINSQLANIVRASTQRPLSFLDIPSITGTGNVMSSASATGMLAAFGPQSMVTPVGMISPSLSLGFGNSFNFTQSSLDNSVFWKAFLAEIPTDYVKYFLHNHMPHEVIMSLVIDSLVTQDANGVKTYYFNNPLHPTHVKFQTELYELINKGLAIRPVKEMISSQGPYTEEDLIKAYGPSYKQVIAGQNYSLETSVAAGKKSFRVNQIKTNYKICINSPQYSNFLKEDLTDNLYCQVPLTPEMLTKANLRINIRSTRNIYDYLGQVVAAQLAEKPYEVTLPPSRYTTNLKEGESNRYKLFVVEKDTSSIRPFAYVESEDGSYYSIPASNNGYSPLVIDLLSQFLTLAKSPGSIPASPAVLIR